MIGTTMLDTFEIYLIPPTIITKAKLVITTPVITGEI